MKFCARDFALRSKVGDNLVLTSPDMIRDKMEIRCQAGAVRKLWQCTETTND